MYQATQRHQTHPPAPTNANGPPFQPIVQGREQGYNVASHFNTTEPRYHPYAQPEYIRNPNYAPAPTHHQPRYLTDMEYQPYMSYPPQFVPNPPPTPQPFVPTHPQFMTYQRPPSPQPSAMPCHVSSSPEFTTNNPLEDSNRSGLVEIANALNIESEYTDDATSSRSSHGNSPVTSQMVSFVDNGTQQPGGWAEARMELQREKKKKQHVSPEAKQNSKEYKKRYYKNLQEKSKRCDVLEKTVARLDKELGELRHQKAKELHDLQVQMSEQLSDMRDEADCLSLGVNVLDECDYYDQREYNKWVAQAKRRGYADPNMLTKERYGKYLNRERCAYCMRPNAMLGIDRVNNHGKYVEDNCVPCCHFCNILKGKSNVYVFERKFILYLRQAAYEYCKMFKMTPEVFVNGDSHSIPETSLAQRLRMMKIAEATINDLPDEF